MDQSTVGRAVLMSIHPRYAYAILRGEKRVEFRKRPIAQDVSHVFIYATKPVCAVIGAFTIGSQETMSPSRLWDLYNSVAGVKSDDFWEYCGTRSLATGIRIESVYLATEAYALDQVFGIPRPPQSYRYIDSDRAKEILQKMQHKANA